MTIITHKKKRERVRSWFTTALTPVTLITRTYYQKKLVDSHRYDLNGDWLTVTLVTKTFSRLTTQTKKLGDNRLAIHVLVDSRYIDYQNYYQKKLIDSHQYDLNGASPLHWLLRLPHDLLLKQKTQRRSNRDSRPFRLRVTWVVQTSYPNSPKTVESRFWMGTVSALHWSPKLPLHPNCKPR